MEEREKDFASESEGLEPEAAAPVQSPFGGGDDIEEFDGGSEGDERFEGEDESEDAHASAMAAKGDESRNPKLKWYAVHTYSGHENKVRTNLLRRVGLENMHDRFGQVLIPTEEVTEMKKGKKTTATRKYFPSYILVEMEMCDEAFHLVNSISGVTGFVGLDLRDPSRRLFAGWAVGCLGSLGGVALSYTAAITILPEGSAKPHFPPTFTAASPSENGLASRNSGYSTHWPSAST